MNLRMICKYLGYLLWTEAAFFLPPVLVTVAYNEPNARAALLLAFAITCAVGLLLHLISRGTDAMIYAREGFVVAGLGWLLISAFGALPFVFSGEIPHFVDAFFETVSGFTTTGSSILTNVEAMSKGLLFWRSFTHWLGGMGILVFILALFRAKHGAGFTLHLLRAESPGPQVGKVLPKTHESARVIYLLYIGLSLINLLFLLAGGMPLFDAVCTMFGTAGTGGFGIKADSMASYSYYLQTVCTVFMALFGVNFSLYYLLWRGDRKSVWKDEELRLYFGIMLTSILLITGTLIVQQVLSAGDSLHHAAFTVSSIMTTTGFATVDFNLWPEFTRGLLLVIMILGSMAGSTGGGIKTARVLIVFRAIKVGIHRLLHPRSVKLVRINNKTVGEKIVWGSFLYLAVYSVIAIVSFLLISLDGFTLETNLSAVLACFNNIGPGLGAVGPTANFAGYSVFSKVILSLNMLLGRLEIFPLLLVFMPSTWKSKT